MDKDNIETQPKKRRRARFSLRTLLLATVVAGALFGWTVNNQMRAAAEAELVEELHAQGEVTYYYDNQFVDGRNRPDSKANKLTLLEKLAGKQTFDRLTKVMTKRGYVEQGEDRIIKLTDDQVQSILDALGRVSSLESLSLHDYRAQDLKPLRKNRKLKELHLYAPKLRDISGLRNFPKLETLTISGTKTITGLEALKACPQLQVLSIPVQEPNLAWASHLTNLQRLNLRRSATLESLDGIEHLQKLNYLVAGYCKNLKDIKQLELVTNLKTLLIDAVHPKCDFSPVAKLTQLETLWINHNQQIKEL